MRVESLETVGSSVVQCPLNLCDVLLIFSVIAEQTMEWAIFYLLPINLKFEWAILS